MSKLEYENFPKFIVSLGVFFVIVPFLVLIFLIQENSILLIYEEELTKLTPLSNEIIISLQNIYKMIITYYKILLPLSITTGIIFVIIGCKKWSKIQKQIDRKSELETKQLELSIEDMTKEEKQYKVEEEVKEIESLKESASKEKKITPKEKLTEVELIKTKYLSIEDKVINKLKNMYHPYYKIRDNIKIGDLTCDALAISNMDTIDRIFEIKYIFSQKTLSSKLLELYSYRLERQISEYQKQTSRKAKGVLVIVTEGNSDKEFINKLSNQIYINNNIHTMYLSESELNNNKKSKKDE